MWTAFVSSRPSKTPLSVRLVGLKMGALYTSVKRPSSFRTAVDRLHGILIDVVGDRRAHAVADLNGARVVHTTPDSSAVTIGARLGNAGIRPVRLPGRCQRKRLLLTREVTEENGRSRTVRAGVPGRIFRMRRRGEEREPTRIWNGVRIIVGIRLRDRGYRPPGHFERNRGVEPLSAKDGERG